MNVQASTLKLGDVICCPAVTENRVCMSPYSTATVKRIDSDGTVHLFRPYTATADFEYTGGVICYVGIEEYSISPATAVTLLERGRALK